MSSNITHQFNDPSLKTLISLVRMNSWAEDQVKQASVDPVYGDSLPDTAFAWEDRRIFPIDTPANAMVSKLYVEKQASEIPTHVRESVDTALILYGIDPQEIMVEAQEKTAAAGDYVFPKTQRWCVQDSDDVRIAEAQILKIDNEISFFEKTGAAIRVLDLAEKHGVTPSMEIMKLAGVVASDLNQTIDWLEARAYMAEAPVSDLFSKLASELSGVDPLCYTRETLVKLAEVINVLDNKAGITQHYNRSIPDPVHTVFNTEKKAEKTIELSGKQVPLSRLMTVPKTAWDSLMGEDINEILTDGEVDPAKVEEIVPTLPRDIHRVLQNYV